MKPDTTNLGRSFTYAVRAKTHAITNWQQMFDANHHHSATVVKRVIDAAERVTKPLTEDCQPETLLRVTWSRATRSRPSTPSASLVTVVDWNFSDQFVITEEGDQVKKSTLYRLPLQARIADIFAKRNERDEND